MAINTFHDFILVTDQVEKHADGAVASFYVCVFDSPVGQGEKKEQVSVPAQFMQQLRWLEARQLDQDVSRQMDLGEVLAALLLPVYARQLFSESLKRLRDDEGLRLRLRLEDELADFPWEYLYINTSRGERTSSGFLALDPRISIVRHEAIAIPGDWFQSPDSRRVVVAMASPQPYARYPKLNGLPAEQRALREALSGIAGLEAVYLPEYATSEPDQRLGATLKDIMASLMKRTDVFHFSGHGEFAEEMGPNVGSVIGEGAIVLANAANEALPVAADRFAEILRGRGVRLVVLGACETGRRDGINVWSSVVASILKAGIPAVVAMQFTIQDALAAEFCGAFYRALVAGFSVDEAVALGRAAIRAASVGPMSDARDWGAPILYLRASNAVVFNPVKKEQARQEAEQRLEHLFEQQVREVGSKGRLIGAVIGTAEGENVTVDQTVDERVSGVVIGTAVYTIQGGRLTVRQNADTVDGTMYGAVIGRLGGSTPSADDNEQQVLAGLERLLRTDTSAKKRGKRH